MSAQECIFCKIARKELPSELLYEDESVVAFKDIQPQAPHHILVIPRKHIPSLAELSEDDAPILGRCQWVAAELAKAHGFSEDGYRTVVNCGKHGQQTVPHIHVHLLGGRQLRWPPG